MLLEWRGVQLSWDRLIIRGVGCEHPLVFALLNVNHVLGQQQRECALIVPYHTATSPFHRRLG